MESIGRTLEESERAFRRAAYQAAASEHCGYARDAIHHARSLTTVFGTEGRPGHSFSLVDHLRWDLRAIFRLAVQDRLLGSNPAEILFTPRTVSRPSRRILSPAQVQQILSVLGLREQLTTCPWRITEFARI